MPVRTAYLSKMGRDYKISPHINLGEFASKDGADKVLYSTELLALLETLRGEAFTVQLNSAYRTAAHNRAVGGASNSQHIYGTGADIQLKYKGEPLDARYVCCRCQSLGFSGVAYISSTSVHVDARPSGTYRGDERKGYRGNVGGDFYTYFELTKTEVDAYFAQFEPEEIEEEEEMTQEKFDQMMENWISRKAEKEPSEWSAEARKWAKDAEIIKGTHIGDEWKSPVDREQFATIIYRLMQKVDPIK